MSMRWRLFLAFCIIILITAATIALFVRHNLEQEVKSYVLRGGRIAPSELITQLEDYYATNRSWSGAEEILGHQILMSGMMERGRRGMGQGNRPSDALRIADENGLIVVDTLNQNSQVSLNPADLSKDAYPLQLEGKVIGYLLPQAGMAFPSELGETALIESLNRGLLTAALISGVVALVLSVGLAYAVSRPVQQLTKAVSFLSSGDLNQRVDVRGRDELSRLGSAFNQMAESLERSEDNRRAMTADIAHELRTPLAIQRAHLEAIQDGIYPLTLENLAPVMEQNHTLAHLVEDLRTLALADAGELRMQIRPTDLKDLIQRLAARFQSRAESLNITIQTRLPQEEAIFQVDPDRINQILNNLVSNALRYTPENGAIRIELGTQQQSAAVITVADSGSGIPEESLPYIFERFYRADKSRSRQEGGTGLGLAIARQLAQMHGGSLTAANAPAGCAVFTLTLPAHA